MLGIGMVYLHTESLVLTLFSLYKKWEKLILGPKTGQNTVFGTFESFLLKTNYI